MIDIKSTAKKVFNKSKIWVFSCISLAATSLAATPTQAAEILYSFSGSIVVEGQSSPPIPEWKFASGLSFNGTVTIDTSLIDRQQTIVDTEDHQLVRYFNPIVELNYSIETLDGTYNYSPPAFANNSFAISSATKPFAFNGADLRWENYPAAFGGTPQIPVPPSATIGNYTPHASFLNIGSNNRPGLVGSTDPDLDLVALFSQLGSFPNDTATLSVRFSDPALWPPGRERIDAVVIGEITSFSQVNGAVPEPTTWAFMIFGFGAIGSAMRLRRKASLKSAALN